MKRLRWLLIPIALILGIWVYFKFAQNPSINALQVIPQDAMYVIDCDEPIENWNHLSSHPIWKVLKQHPLFEDLTVEADYLDSLILANSTLFSKLGHRQLIVSAHPTKPGDYDFLFVVDLKNGAKHDVVILGLEQILKQSGFSVSNSTYKDIKMIQAKDYDASVLTLAQVKNQLICSYTPDLVRNSIDASQDSSLAINPDFLKVFDKIGGNDIARFYMNYSQLERLMTCYFSEGLETYRELGSLLKYTAADFNLEESSWTLDGYTNVHNKESYLNAVIESGTSENTAGDVLSNRTAWFLSFNFTSFDQFYSSLQNQWAADESFNASFDKYQKRLETLLKISLQENLLSWIGDEVTVAQLRNNSMLSKKQNSVVMIKANDIEAARSNLNFVTEQVRKRTPAMFKRIDYRSYQIQYLDIKGFFRTFFGNAFDKIEKPYFGIIGEYVVFSNSPYTLIGMIEDFEHQRNLSHLPYYQDYLKQSKESSVTLFASPTNMYPVILPLLDADGRKELAKDEHYFKAFESFGLQLRSEKGMLGTAAILRLAETSEEEKVETTDEKSLSKLYERYGTEIDAEHFALQLIEDDLYKKYYPGTDIIEIKGETKNGTLHGDYFEYYKNGNPRVEGRYKMGRKKGTWILYDEAGNTTRKKY